MIFLCALLGALFISTHAFRSINRLAITFIWPGEPRPFLTYIISHMNSTLTALISSVAVCAAVLAPSAMASTASHSPVGYAPIEQYKAPPAPAPGELRKFSAPSGASVLETLERWARQAGWEVVIWNLPADTDFTLGAAVKFEGDVGQAAKGLIAALGSEAHLVVTVDEKNRSIAVAPAP